MRSRTLTPSDRPIETALILICEKCGKKLSGSNDPDVNPSRLLQAGLKAGISADGQKGALRAVVTTCLDVCPEGTVAVAIVPMAPGDVLGPVFYEVDVSDLGLAVRDVLAGARLYRP